MQPAKLPAELLEKERRTIADLAPGETAHVTFTALEVGEDGSCYLLPQGKLQERTLLTMQVSRRADGYHVLVGPKLTFRATRIAKRAELIPVASIEAFHGTEIAWLRL